MNKKKMNFLVSITLDGNLGTYIVFLEKGKDAFTNFVKMIQNAKDEFVTLLAEEVVGKESSGIKIETAFRGSDIKLIQNLSALVSEEKEENKKEKR